MAATMAENVSPSPDFAQWEQQSSTSRSRSSRPRSEQRERDKDRQRSRRRSSQHVKSRPANPTVINSILESLDTLTPPPIITGEDRFSDTDSRSSRPRSAQGTIGSLPSLAPSTSSPGFGVEYGTGLALDDDEGASNAALPPTIRTSRPPSGLSHYSESRRSSFTHASPGGGLHAPSLSKRSSRSSLNQVKGAVSPNKLSAASWVKQNSMSQETFESKKSSKSKESGGGRKSRRRSLRRINSQESLRMSRTEIKFVPPAPRERDDSAEPPPNISRAEQIIAKARTPPPPKSRKRLFLTDDGSEEQVERRSEAAEDMQSASPPPPIKRASERELLIEPELEDDMPDRSASPPPIKRASKQDLRAEQNASPPPIKRASKQDLRAEQNERVKSPHPVPSSDPIEEKNERKEEIKSPHRVSPNNPIEDSIPMRTSSLRQSSNSPKPGKRKEKKSKRHTAKGTKVDSKVSSIAADRDSKTIPEDSWADLGEDDETVKRIRELREQRKSRLLDSRAISMPDGVPTAANVEANHEPQPPKVGKGDDQPELTSAVRSDEANKRASRTTTRPTPNRASTVDTPSKALKVLGITGDALSQLPQQGVNGLSANTDATSKPTPDLMRQRKYSLDQNRPGIRPPTALSSHSTTPPLSLDYSYAQAVDALQGTESEVRRKEQQQQQHQQQQQPTLMKPSPLKTTYLDLVSSDTPLRDTSPTIGRKTSTKRRQDRWTLHHPDLPLDSERKKNRRKSTSDARLGRERDEATEPVPRRDSVEIAVLEYLQNPRLSRKLRHPQTGRVISFSEVGDPNGATVFVCLGMGLTRFVTAFYDELATTLRLRLITIDRPGVGNSEPYPPNDRSGPLSWPDDVLAICQHLGIQSFSLLAHSAGAIYALASALILPHMIQGKVHLLAPWIPPSQLQAVSHSAATAPPAAALPRSQRFLRVLPTPFLKAANSSFMTATSASLKPNTKRNKTSAKLETIHQNTVSDYPIAPPRRPASSARPSTSDGGAGAGATTRPGVSDFTRRESMMLMDQFMPSINPMENFPMAAQTSTDDNAETPLRRGSLVMSATATPMDPSFEYAYSALNAAEHEARQRKSEFTTRLTQSTWELATKDSNPATDLLVCLERNRDVGFRYTDVTREVVITHGSEDRRVPVGNVKWLAEQMNRRALGLGDAGSRDGGERYGRGGCEVRVLEGEGHGLMASPLIMGDVLTEIAGYWSRTGKGLGTLGV